MTENALQPDALTRPPGAAAARPSGGRAGGGYTRFVALMKVALPLAAGILVLLVVIWPQLQKRSEGFRLEAAGPTLPDSQGQDMINARYNGIDQEGRPYTVTAESATQPESQSDAVNLTAPKADLTTDGGAWLALSAETGLYHRKASALDLAGNVNGFHDQGYEFYTRTARVDLKAGTAAGDDPVAGHGPLGEMKGSGFRITERGKRMLLTGKSQLTIFPSQKPGEKKAGAQ
jgi:lipopolysaccharide export system protein LptC